MYLTWVDVKVEQFKFADGTVWDSAYINSLTLNATGTNGDDSLYGHDGKNTLLGGEGNDTFYGNKGDDVLSGGAGNDIYHFATGFGQDTIKNDALNPASENDIVIVDTKASNLVFTQETGGHMKMSVLGDNSSVMIQDWYNNDKSKVDTIKADTQSIAASNIQQLIQQMATFTTKTGISWEDAVKQNNKEALDIIASNYQNV